MENNGILAYENVFCIVSVGERCKVRTKIRNHKVVRHASEKNIKCTQKHKNVGAGLHCSLTSLQAQQLAFKH